MELERVVMGSPSASPRPRAGSPWAATSCSRGADSPKVLDLFYDVAIKEQPDLVDAYLATAELALAKQDYALAAETLRKAPKAAAEDPRFHYLLARAYSAEDRAGSDKELAEALKINPNHVDSLLLQADHLIDSEKYDEAAQVLKQVHEVNPARAAGLRLPGRAGPPAATTPTARPPHASRPWRSGPTNPEVDHLIGRKLSQKYRFAEGSAYQRQALEFDPDYQPAKIQLCQDLLRLGDEAEGWKLAAEIFASDAYNVVAFNLDTLRDRLAGFRTLEGDGFVVRMDPREADLYGHRVLDLLGRAQEDAVRTLRRRRRRAR